MVPICCPKDIPDGRQVAFDTQEAELGGLGGGNSQSPLMRRLPSMAIPHAVHG
jgi:hypothetical protein